MKTKLRYIGLLLIFALILVVSAACTKTTGEQEDLSANEITAENLSIDVDKILMATGESFTLGYAFEPKNTTKNAVEYSTDSEVVTITETGIITAKKAGVAKVTVKQKDGDKSAECTITVADIIVDGSLATSDQGSSQTDETTEQTNENPNNDATNGNDLTTANSGDVNSDLGENDQNSTDGNTTNDQAESPQTSSSKTTDSGENDEDVNSQTQPDNIANPNPVINVGGEKDKTLFANFSKAIAAAKDGDTILVKSGDYNETVSVNKSLTILGEGSCKINKLRVEKSGSLKIENVIITDTRFPSGNDARVYLAQGAELEIKKCVIETSSQDQLEGGYGIFAEKQVKKLTIDDNTISNFRYCVYICPTDQTVTITNNKLSNAQVGIGIDIRQENTQNNYPTKGKISSNEYNEVQSKTQFLHHGENYDGDFDFEDNDQDIPSETQPQGMTE